MTALDADDQPTNEEVKRRHEDVRAMCFNFADGMVGVTRPGREQSSMVAAIELAMFWANADIARHQGDTP
ncbi:MAG: hypothetical protein M3Y91_15740 [Actinomycetota bacterium]|nr:hypothetical protein [Actinomycetota bacterium]